MPKAVAERIAALWGLKYIEGYGLSETIAPTHINPRDRPAREQCLGLPIQNTTAIVVDPQTLQPLAAGAVGEIQVNGPQVFRGYWGKPEATAEAFTEVEGPRYFRTGDDLWLHRRGRLFLHGRPAQAHDQRLRLQDLAGGGRGAALPGIRRCWKPVSSASPATPPAAKASRLS